MAGDWSLDQRLEGAVLWGLEELDTRGGWRK